MLFIGSLFFVRRENMKPSRSIRLSHLINIGAKTEHMLNEVDIWTRQDLQEAGPIEAWNRIKKLHPDQATLAFLYVLQGALLGVPWHKLPEEAVDELLAGMTWD
jgi:DNA transformation protein and related proteins